MPTAGKRVLTSNGKRALNSSGKRLLFDSSGECPECCDEGTCAFCSTSASSYTATANSITICTGCRFANGNDLNVSSPSSIGASACCGFLGLTCDWIGTTAAGSVTAKTYSSNNGSCVGAETNVPDRFSFELIRESTSAIALVSLYAGTLGSGGFGVRQVFSGVVTGLASSTCMPSSFTNSFGACTAGRFGFGGTVSVSANCLP